MPSSEITLWSQTSSARLEPTVRLISHLYGLCCFCLRCFIICLQEWFTNGLLAYYMSTILLLLLRLQNCYTLSSRLCSEFAMTDLGDLSYFLGISLMRTSDGIQLSQCQHAIDLLKRAGMAKCHATTTPIDTRAKLLAIEGGPVSNALVYRSIVGALQYLTLTRPDLSYAMEQVCLYMHTLREPNLALVKHILRYVKGTLNLELHIAISDPCSIVAYLDSYWTCCPDTHRSTSG
jgi:hypothetical protein